MKKRLVFFVLLCVCMLFSACKKEQPGSSSAGNDGIHISAPGTNVDITSDGIRVKAPYTDVKVDDAGVKVEAPGTDVQIGEKR